MESKDRQEHAAASQAVGDAPPLVLGNRSEEKAPAGKGKMELPPTSWDAPLDPNPSTYSGLGAPFQLSKSSLCPAREMNWVSRTLSTIARTLPPHLCPGVRVLSASSTVLFSFGPTPIRRTRKRRAFSGRFSSALRTFGSERAIPFG